LKVIHAIEGDVGGEITSTIMELAVYPAIYFLWRSRGLEKKTVQT
jgi:hypothetical protein